MTDFEVDPQKETMKVLLGQVDTLSDDHVVKSSLMMDAGCGHLCWVSKTTRDAMKAHDGPIETTCIQCCGLSENELIAQAEAGDIKAAPGAFEEIEDHLGFDITNALPFRLQEHEL